MFCIAAFIVLLFMAAVSAKYRRYLSKAWHCTFRRVTFRPCDISFKDEVKGRLLARVAVRKPKMVKAASIGLEIAAFLVIVLTVWSLYVVVKSGLNLYVYGTCNPSNAASCSLGAEACSIEEVKPSFVDSAKSFKLHEWFGSEFSDFGKTITSVPARARDWKAADYQPANASYSKPYDASKPIAVEIIDPGCLYCQQLYRNIKQAAFDNRYNLTYIAYPIPDSTQPSGYKFSNSKLIVSYLEAIRLQPPKQANEGDQAVDWRILDRLFVGTTDSGANWQTVINTSYSNNQTTALLHEWLAEFGYSEGEIDSLQVLAASDQVASIMADNERLVRDEIKTVKIPTIIYDGRRHDGVVKAEDL